MNDDPIKESEIALKAIVDKLKTDISGIRGNRVSMETLEHIRVNCYDQSLTIQQLGSLAIVPPHEIVVTAWDPDVVATIAKAIESAQLGLSVSTDGLSIRARLSSLAQERREELEKQAKKMGEASRISVRTSRDESIKKIRAKEEDKSFTKDYAFKAKERVQKLVDDANDSIEQIVEKKIQDLSI